MTDLVKRLIAHGDTPSVSIETTLLLGEAAARIYADGKIFNARIDAIEECATYHDSKAKIFRNAIEQRQEYNIPYGEHLLNAEWHETAARDFRKLKEKK